MYPVKFALHTLVDGFVKNEMLFVLYVAIYNSRYYVVAYVVLRL